MFNFKISVADIVIDITANYNSTKIFCQDFITDKPADFSVTVTKEDILFERQKANDSNIYSDEYLENLALYRKICEELPMYNVFLFHGSALSLDGEAYLFTAKSGTGKSTHSSIWRKVFKERVTMVNDDKPLIKITQKGAFVCGTPWRGKHSLGENIIVPLKAICYIKRSQNNNIVKVTITEILTHLLQQTYRPNNVKSLEKVLGLISKLTKRVNFY